MVASASQRPPQTLAGDLAMAFDPVAFARSIDVEPDAWQADVMRSPSHRLLLNCARQTGKSTTTAIIALHSAIFRPDQTILLLSPTLEQSKELFHKCTVYYGRTGAILPSSSETKQRLELQNGSRIVSLPGKEESVRGWTADMLIVDEASRTDDDLYPSIRPMMITTQGRFIALSTPRGKRGWWAEEWHGPRAWKRVQVTAEDCPRITAEDLAEERETMGQFWFDQEYRCLFLDGVTNAFNSDDIDRVFKPGVETWDI